jgi:hypothetical protein
MGPVATTGKPAAVNPDRLFAGLERYRHVNLQSRLTTLPELTQDVLRLTANSQKAYCVHAGGLYTQAGWPGDKNACCWAYKYGYIGRNIARHYVLSWSLSHPGRNACGLAATRIALRQLFWLTGTLVIPVDGCHWENTIEPMQGVTVLGSMWFLPVWANNTIDRTETPYSLGIEPEVRNLWRALRCMEMLEPRDVPKLAALQYVIIDLKSRYEQWCEERKHRL